MKTKNEKLFMRRSSNSYHSHRRRAKEKGEEINYDLLQLRQVIRQVIAKGCPYCKGKVTEATFECDHVIPIARGGTFAGWNVTACCEACNGAKGPLTGGEFQALLLVMDHMEEAARRNIMSRLKAGGRIVRGV